MDHAVGAVRVTRFGAVCLPCGLLNQFIESIGIAILEQIAGLLPPKNVVSRHSPGSAGIVPLAHQEFHKQR